MTKNYFCSMIEWYGIIIIIQFKNHGVTKMDAILVFVIKPIKSRDLSEFIFIFSKIRKIFTSLFRNLQKWVRAFSIQLIYSTEVHTMLVCTSVEFQCITSSTNNSIVTEGRWKKTRQNHSNTLVVCNEPQFWASFCFCQSKKNLIKFPRLRPFLRQIFS